MPVTIRIDHSIQGCAEIACQGLPYGLPDLVPLCRAINYIPASLPALLNGGRTGEATTSLRVLDIVPTTAPFTCDRGPRNLPAFQLQVTGMRAPCVVLDPTVGLWWPPNRGARGFPRT